jgi:DNA mismatch repair protein MLH3
MFNDPLSRTRCERLVRELAETALPLQCAHGRPSTAPIHELGPRTSSRRPAPAIDWARFAASCAHVLE